MLGSLRFGVFLKSSKSSPLSVEPDRSDPYITTTLSSPPALSATGAAPRESMTGVHRVLAAGDAAAPRRPPWEERSPALSFSTRSTLVL